MPSYALPRTAAEVQAQLDAIEKMRCEESLFEFFKRAWRVVDPAPLQVNWHHESLALHYEAVVRGEIRRFIGNVPPRHSKPVSVDAQVQTKSGLIRLGAIIVGDYVLTHKRRWKKVTGVHDQGACEGLLLTTKHGRELRLALDHPVLTPEGWVQAWMLKAGDVLGVVPGLASGRDTITKEEARLLGYIVGDGSCIYGAPVITCKDDLVAQDIRLCATAGGMAIKEAAGVKVRSLRIVSGMTRRQLVDEYQVGRKGGKGPITLWLEQHGIAGKSSYEKRIPQAVMEGSDAIAANFLGAYWACDGWITLRGKERGDFQVGVSSVNKDLMLDVQRLLCRLGIESVVREKFNKNLVTKRQGIGYRSYVVTLSSADDVWRFSRKISISHEKDDRIRKTYAGRFDFDRDIWGDTLISVEPIGRIECRCLTIDDDKSFTAEGIAVHNSLLTSVCLPAWIWIQPEVGPLSGPQVKFLCVSYGQTLSEDLARLCRLLVKSPWYQGHWGDRVRLSGEIDRVDNFGTEAGGFRIASSITGALLGRGGDCRILDDLLSVDQAESKIERENVNKMYSEALQSRETDPKTSAEIIIMQRLHEDDLTGHILSADPPDVVNVVYPTRHDPARHSITDWYEDPRTEAGELLWPERFDEATIAATERRLGPYAFAGQHQQMPTPRGGGIFQREWIQPWPPLGPDGVIMPGWIQQRGTERRIVPPSFEFIMASVDTGFTEKKQNDPSALTVWGVFREEGKSEIQRTPDGGYVRLDEPGGVPKAMCIWGWAKHLKLRGVPTDRPAGVSEKEWQSAVWLPYQQKNWGLVEWVIWTCKRWKVQYLRVETQGQGHNLEDEIRRELSDNLPWTLELVPAKQDKVAMAHSVVPIWSGGQVVFPQYEDGSFPTWLTPILDEVFIFPRGRHDDATDTVVSSLRYLREAGMLERSEEIKSDESSLAQYERYRPVRLPYMS